MRMKTESSGRIQTVAVRESAARKEEIRSTHPQATNLTENLIASYVEQDPTKFCTYEEFETGVDTLKSFCLLRAESIRGQLDGMIPSTSDGQQEDYSALVDASSISLTDMGSMGHGGGTPGGGERPD